jgi:hypothetical protein
MSVGTSEPASTITVHVPMTFTSRGSSKLIISDEIQTPPQPRTDNALLKALARAHRWRQKIENGEYASITELAKEEKVNQSYACRLLRLTLLSPAVVNDILNSRHPSGLTLKDLVGPLSSRWDEQVIALKAKTSYRATCQAMD